MINELSTEERQLKMMRFELHLFCKWALDGYIKTTAKAFAQYQLGAMERIRQYPEADFYTAESERIYEAVDRVDPRNPVGTYEEAYKGWSTELVLDYVTQPEYTMHVDPSTYPWTATLMATSEVGRTIENNQPPNTRFCVKQKRKKK